MPIAEMPHCLGKFLTLLESWEKMVNFSRKNGNDESIMDYALFVVAKITWQEIVLTPSTISIRRPIIRPRKHVPLKLQRPLWKKVEMKSLTRKNRERFSGCTIGGLR